MLPTLGSSLALCAALAILHQYHTHVSPVHLYILYTITIAMGMVALIAVEAEPWAYLLCGAGASLYATITAFHRKYYKVSLSKSSRHGSTRRARRRRC
jgi:hypothetical protein